MSYFFERSDGVDTHLNTNLEMMSSEPVMRFRACQVAIIAAIMAVFFSKCKLLVSYEKDRLFER